VALRKATPARCTMRAMISAGSCRVAPPRGSPDAQGQPVVPQPRPAPGPLPQPLCEGPRRQAAPRRRRRKRTGEIGRPHISERGADTNAVLMRRLHAGASSARTTSTSGPRTPSATTVKRGRVETSPRFRPGQPQTAGCHRTHPDSKETAPASTVPAKWLFLLVWWSRVRTWAGEADGFTAMLIGAGRVRVKSSARAGGLLAGVTPSWCGVWCPCGPSGGLDGGGLPVTPAGLRDLSPFYSLAAGT